MTRGTSALSVGALINITLKHGVYTISRTGKSTYFASGPSGPIADKFPSYVKAYAAVIQHNDSLDTRIVSRGAYDNLVYMAQHAPTAQSAEFWGKRLRSARIAS